jgi:hypothetical protein
MIPGKFINDDGSVTVYEAGTNAELHVIHYAVSESGTPLDGIEAMLTHWYPSADEISRMIDGKPIALSIVGSRHPWVKVGVSE